MQKQLDSHTSTVNYLEEYYKAMFKEVNNKIATAEG